jgi:chromosome segregation ATPase
MNPRSANIPGQLQGRDKKRQRQDLGMVRAIEGIGQRETRRPTHMQRAGRELAPIPLGACTAERMITGGGICINPLTSSVQEQTTFRHGKSSRSFVKGTRAREEEMAASSSRNLSVEERLKQLDDTLEKLKQSLQFQLDFLENLDTEAGRRMEQLEQDLSSVKIGFSEELDKLHQELKIPQEKFEDRIGELESKLSKLNMEWGEGSEK